MPKKKSKHAKSKSKRKTKAKHKTHHFALHAHDRAPQGHHARLRKHHPAAAKHHAGSSHPSAHHSASPKKGRTGHARKRSALMERLHAAAAGAREQLHSFGRRRKHHQPEKAVTEQTLRDQMALRRVRRCSH
jgi:hypothetical protein